MAAKDCVQSILISSGQPVFRLEIEFCTRANLDYAVVIDKEVIDVVISGVARILQGSWITP